MEQRLKVRNEGNERIHEYGFDRVEKKRTGTQISVMVMAGGSTMRST